MSGSHPEELLLGPFNMRAVGDPSTIITVGRGEEFGGERVFCAWSIIRESVVIGPLLELKERMPPHLYLEYSILISESRTFPLGNMPFSILLLTKYS